jgi:hypothetical protein
VHLIRPLGHLAPLCIICRLLSTLVAADMSELDVHELETAIYNELLKEEDHGEL